MHSISSNLPAPAPSNIQLENTSLKTLIRAATREGVYEKHENAYDAVADYDKSLSATIAASTSIFSAFTSLILYVLHHGSVTRSKHTDLTTIFREMLVNQKDNDEVILGNLKIARHRNYVEFSKLDTNEAQLINISMEKLRENFNNDFQIYVKRLKESGQELPEKVQNLQSELQRIAPPIREENVTGSIILDNDNTISKLQQPKSNDPQTKTYSAISDPEVNLKSKTTPLDDEFSWTDSDEELLKQESFNSNQREFNYLYPHQISLAYSKQTIAEDIKTVKFFQTELDTNHGFGSVILYSSKLLKDIDDQEVIVVEFPQNQIESVWQKCGIFVGNNTVGKIKLLLHNNLLLETPPEFEKQVWNFKIEFSVESEASRQAVEELKNQFAVLKK